MKNKFNAHIQTPLNTILNHIENRMNVYRKWYKLDLHDDKYKTRNAIMKDLSLKLGFGSQHRWILSAIILDEFKSEGGVSSK